VVFKKIEKMDKISIERIKLAHPKVRESLLQQYKEINKMLPVNVRLRFTSILRTPEEQHVLFLQKPKVTNADRWQSIHNYGLAFDMVLLYDKDGNGTFETASWEQNKYWLQVANYFMSKGWEWGGKWFSFKDAPHFQKAFDLNWRKMKAKIDSGDFIIENGVKYINL
jgi:peptidoglycan L-alanyl-D-glutamate endopeptidase CwlK